MTAVARTIAYCVLAHCTLQWNSTFRLDSFRNQLHSAFLYVLKTSLLYIRCLRAVNIKCIKSKVDLLQKARSWANAGVLFDARVGRRVAFETIKLIHAKVLCTIFDTNHHPNIAHINMQGASVLVLT